MIFVIQWRIGAIAPVRTTLKLKDSLLKHDKTQKQKHMGKSTGKAQKQNTWVKLKSTGQSN